jgi:hypothetical protein
MQGEGESKKTIMEKELSLLVPIWCRRKIQMHLVIRRRTSKRTTRSLSKQSLLRRKRTKKMVALFAGAMSIGQVRPQTANLSKKRNQQTWLLARLKEEHLGIEILYLLFFQSVICLSSGWTQEPI